VDTVLLEATGTFGQGKLELLSDAIRIIRGKRSTIIPLTRITDIYYAPATAFRNGSIAFGVQRDLDEAESEPGDRDATTVRFVRRQQRGFDAIRLLIEHKLERTALPERRMGAGAERGGSKVHTLDVELSQANGERETMVPEGKAPEGPSPASLQTEASALETPGAEVAVPAGFSLLRLAAIGTMVHALNDSAGERLDEWFREMLAGLREERIRLERAVDALEDRQADAAHTFLLTCARGFAGQMEQTLTEAGRAYGSGRRTSRNTAEFIGTLLATSTREGICAAALVDVVADGDLGVMPGLVFVMKAVETVVGDPQNRHPEAIEPLFAQMTQTFKTLKAGVDRRRQELFSIREQEQRDGAEALLRCAEGAWQEGLDALTQARQDYVLAGDRWASRARQVIANVEVLAVQAMGGQAALHAFDTYRDMELPALAPETLKRG
jgi:hypothetical protein